MKLIPQHIITVADNRQRQEFDEAALQELASSIEDRGLLHPLVVRNNIGGGYELVAGERRLRAIQQIYELGGAIRFDGMDLAFGEVPIVNLGDLPPLEAKEIELEENIRRSDLTWQERVKAEAELTQLRLEKAVAAGKPTPKMADLAQEIKGVGTARAAASLSEASVLARNMHRPEVSGAKSQHEALKAMKRVEEKERNAELATKLGAEHLSGQHLLVQGDSLKWMADQEAHQYDVICTDPPYGMGADDFGDSGGKTGGAHFYADGREWWEDYGASVAVNITRMAKASAHLYLFCDFDRFHAIKALFENKGNWIVFRTPLIWYKPAAFRAPWPDKGPQRKYECILYAVRGDLKCTQLAGDVIQCPPDENLGHPAQKPVELLKNLLARSVRPGMKVLDPFCGSGPVFEAGHALSAIVTGVEMDAAAAGIAAGRLEKLKGST